MKFLLSILGAAWVLFDAAVLAVLVAAVFLS